MKNWAYWRVRLFGPAHSLGRRITIYTIAFSSLIMLVMSVTQLGLEYRDLRTGLDKELDGIEVFVPNLSGSVWSFDQKQIQLALDGLDRLPNILYVRVTDAEGGKEWVSGVLPPSNTLSRDFDLSILIKGKNTVIGHLVVVASLDEIKQQIIDRAVIIVLSNGLKSFLVALFSLFLFRHLVARRLEKMTEYLRGLTPLVFPASAQTAMPGQSRPERLDELEVLEWTLSRTESDLKRASVELEQHSDHLGALVEERTHELKMQNEELAQRQEQLKDSLERFQQLFDRASDGIMTVSPSGQLLAVNEASARMHGYTKVEMSSLNLKDFGTPETLRLASGRFERLLGGEAMTFEVEHYHKDGHTLALEVSASLIIFGAEPVIQGFHRDITERKAKQAALRDHQERLNTIIDTVGDPIFVKDNDHRIVLANQAFYDIFAQDESAVMGQTLAENVPADERQHFLEIDRRVLDTGIPDVSEEALSVIGKATRTIVTRKSRFIESSGERFLVGSIHDITERKRAEEAIRALNAT
ncbi:MAG: PAS domain S-box protein, partial [Comamonadaceae bacterium]